MNGCVRDTAQLAGMQVGRVGVTAIGASLQSYIAAAVADALLACAGARVRISHQSCCADLTNRECPHKQVGIKALAPCPLKSSKRDPGLKAVSWHCRPLGAPAQPFSRLPAVRLWHSRPHRAAASQQHRPAMPPVPTGAGCDRRRPDPAGRLGVC